MCRFRDDELDMTDWEATKFEILSFRGDDDKMEVNPILGTRLFRGDKLDMID